MRRELSNFKAEGSHNHEGHSHKHVLDESPRVLQGLLDSSLLSAHLRLLQFRPAESQEALKD